MIVPPMVLKAVAGVVMVPPNVTAFPLGKEIAEPLMELVFRVRVETAGAVIIALVLMRTLFRVVTRVILRRVWPPKSVTYKFSAGSSAIAVG